MSVNLVKMTLFQKLSKQKIKISWICSETLFFDVLTVFEYFLNIFDWSTIGRSRWTFDDGRNWSSNYQKKKVCLSKLPYYFARECVFAKWETL